jgi:hypothetical protein
LVGKRVGRARKAGERLHSRKPTPHTVAVRLAILGPRPRGVSATLVFVSVAFAILSFQL